MALGTVNGVNAALIAAVPSNKIGPGEVNGYRTMLYDEYVLTGEAADGDLVNMGALIPAGARVMSAVVKGPDLGATGTLNLGNLASADASEGASATGFISGADSSGQAFQVSGAGTNIGHKFLQPVQAQLKFVGATSGATGLKVQMWLDIVVY